MQKKRFGAGAGDVERLREVHRAVKVLGFTYSHIEFPEERGVRIYFKLPDFFNGMTPAEVEALKRRSVREVALSGDVVAARKRKTLHDFEEQMCLWAAGRVQRVHHTQLPHGLHAAVQLKSLFLGERDLLEGLEGGGEV